MEKKKKGEFKPCGSEDVLTTVLETPEHSGRVRAVGGFITPKAFFKMPRHKSTRITKSELDKTKRDLMLEISQLKALINSQSTHHSPILSDKASFHPQKDKTTGEKSMEVKADVVRDLDLEDEDCIAIDPPSPPPEKKVKINAF